MITSLQNPFVKRIVKLHQSRMRRSENRFLIEGEKEITLAIQAGINFEALIICPDLLAQRNLITNLQAKQITLELIEVSPAVYAKIAYRDSTSGLVALAHTPSPNIANLQLPSNPLLLIVDGIEKPGNLGALLRTADAAAIDALIVCDPDLDIYNPNVIRASLGAIFTVPIFQFTAGQTRQYLTANNINPVLTSPAASQPYTAIDYTQPTAIVLGSEKQGLSQDWLCSPATSVKIPLLGKMDSLNLSNSGAIIIYEARRQRDKP